MQICNFNCIKISGAYEEMGWTKNETIHKDSKAYQNQIRTCFYTATNVLWASKLEKQCVRVQPYLGSLSVHSVAYLP